VWTDVDIEKDEKVKGIEELGRKVEQHHQLEKRPLLQFDSPAPPQLFQLLRSTFRPSPRCLHGRNPCQPLAGPGRGDGWRSLAWRARGACTSWSSRCAGDRPAPGWPSWARRSRRASSRRYGRAEKLESVAARPTLHECACCRESELNRLVCSDDDMPAVRCPGSVVGSCRDHPRGGIARDLPDEQLLRAVDERHLRCVDEGQAPDRTLNVERTDESARCDAVNVERECLLGADRNEPIGASCRRSR
jgi:hypothetical protein